MIDSNCTSLVLPETPRKIGLSPDWLKMRDLLVDECKGFQCANEEGFNAGSEILQRITKLSNQLEKFRKDFTAPYLSAQKAVKKMADAAREPLETCKSMLKMQLGEYAEKQRKIEAEERRKAEQAAQAEAARLAQENADAADLLGDDAPQEELVLPSTQVERRAVSDSARVIKRIVFEVSDEDAIPRAFMMVDERKINQFKREHEDLIIKAVEDGKPDAPIPGVVFAVKTDVASR